MDLRDKPELLEQLAAAYALGTLRGGARRRFEAMARHSPTVRAAALLWQERFSSMTELQLMESPGPNVWKRIENMVRAQPDPATAQEVPMADMMDVLRMLRRQLKVWRGAALAGSLAGVLAIVVAVGVGISLNRELSGRDEQLAQAGRSGAQLAQQNAQLAARLQAAPAIQYVAVLADENAAASMLVTFDPVHSTLTLKRVGGYQEAADKSLQLWALPPGGPKSLGVLGGDAVIKLTAGEAQVSDAPVLAISLEPKGGVPAGSGPTGPVLFKGALLQTAL